MTAGVFSAIAGYFWGLTFPVNENLWTSSFVLVTSGFAALMFGAIYYLVDIKGRTRGTLPFIMFGANAITIYFSGGNLGVDPVRMEDKRRLSKRTGDAFTYACGHRCSTGKPVVRVVLCLCKFYTRLLAL